MIHLFAKNYALFQTTGDTNTFECTFDDGNDCSNIFEIVNPFTTTAAQLAWQRARGPTPTSGTGPNTDHTTSTSKSVIKIPLPRPSWLSNVPEGRHPPEGLGLTLITQLVQVCYKDSPPIQLN